MEMRIHTRDREYPILLERGILNRAGQAADLNRRVLVVSDEGVPAAYRRTLLAQCGQGAEAVVPQGEGSKSLAVYEGLCRQLLALRFSRRDCIVALGGGVVGDLAGFAAATYLRGIDFINIPTTTLAQVDSSVGGKTALNLNEVKNVLGAFYPPSAVLIDPDTLATLPPRHRANGLVEAVKAGLIADPALFELFEQAAPEDALEQILARALRVKARVVEQDERETGLRRILNFGHTLGHGAESACGLSRLLHGEAVALGMLPMITDSGLRERTRRVLNRLGVPLTAEFDVETAYTAMLRDKKARGDRVTVIEVDRLGEAVQREAAFGDLKARLYEMGGTDHA